MINYIILSHNSPHHLYRLVNKLQNANCCFYIHIDKKANISPFIKLLDGCANVVFVKQRESVLWADIGIVKATLNCLKQLIADQRKGYCVLLSGQDYPIKSKIEIEAFFTENYGREFIDATALPIEGLIERGMDRIESYKINLSTKRKHLVVCASVFQPQFYRFQTIKNIVKLTLANKLHLFIKVFKKRTHPTYIKPYFGSQWWALTTETVQEILKFLNANPDYLHYHKYTFVPDEVFFQSIVALLFKDKLHLIQDSVTFVDWGRENSDGDAPILGLSDYELLKQQPIGKLFARKFENNNSILDELDKL
jgi:hypothetical protein